MISSCIARLPLDVIQQVPERTHAAFTSLYLERLASLGTSTLPQYRFAGHYRAVLRKGKWRAKKILTVLLSPAFDVITE